MTGKWFSFDEDFSQLIDRTKSLSEQTKYMSPKPKQVRLRPVFLKYIHKQYTLDRVEQRASILTTVPQLSCHISELFTLPVNLYLL